ncbi:MAG TPA: glycosyltransferase family 2 protein, partial [Candidatus Dojkabacteria bacterium]|nr:glycosyltransferase family 2 protein [Candidatus Dojkabacteria bacterium]
SKGSVKNLLNPLLTNEKVGGVTGRPFAINKKDSFMGYVGNLLSDSAHHKRTHTMKKFKSYYVSDKTFFPMSGYILAMRNVIKEIPTDVLSDDAYMSYAIRNLGYEIAYTPNAKVAVKYPTNVNDYLKQKVRSLGGYIQLEKYDIFKKDKQSRSFWIELPYAFFVFKYAKNFREFIWSLMLFPLRLYTWIQIFIERRLLKKGMPKTGWARIESTK